VTEAGIQAFYERFLARLESAGVPVVILGGQAMLRHRLAETTKDADLFVRPDHFAVFLQMLAGTRYEGVAPIYRTAISAPLAVPWASAGWSAHFEFPVEQGPRPRLDILARPPRIDSDDLPRSGVAPLFLLAETKKTRREAKDWGQVATLGHLLLDAGDSRGLLLIQNREELLERLRDFPPDEQLIARRPNLRLAWQGSDRLGPALETEQRFWRHFDAGRWSVFTQTSRDYVQAVWRQEKDWPSALPDQHERLCRLAADHLPKDPLGEHGVETLVNEASRRTLLGYPPEFAEFLPPRSVVLQPWKPNPKPPASAA
jgi:hypothetical protein